MTNVYCMQQKTAYGIWEPVPEGEFETADEAVAGMRELESAMGWRDLRVIEQLETVREDGATEVDYGDVIETGEMSPPPPEEAFVE